MGGPGDGKGVFIVLELLAKTIKRKGKKITILLVDSDQAFRESVINLFLACGVEKFEIASSTEEAVEIIAGNFFDIIFVDLFMPDMNGLRFAKKYQKRLPKTNIILLIEDQQLPTINSAGEAKLNFPAILKSFMIRNLRQILSDDSMLVDILNDFSN